MREHVMEVVNAALERSDWREVQQLVPSVYAYALRCGDGLTAELLESLYGLAREALALPVFSSTEGEIYERSHEI